MSGCNIRGCRGNADYQVNTVRENGAQPERFFICSQHFLQENGCEYLYRKCAITGKSILMSRMLWDWKREDFVSQRAVADGNHGTYYCVDCYGYYHGEPTYHDMVNNRSFCKAHAKRLKPCHKCRLRFDPYQMKKNKTGKMICETCSPNY